MSVITVVPTVEAGNNPPRVRLDVTDTGTPAIFSVNVTRLNPDGRTVPVRTGDGQPLTLATSGSDRVGILYDYEMPYGLEVGYGIEGGSTTVAVTVPVDGVWLVHPGVPALSVPVELRAGSLDEEGLSIGQGVFWPMGRSTPIVVTEGTRRGAQSSMIVAAETSSEVARLRSLLSDGGPLLLNVPPSLGFDWDTSYIAVSDVTISRLPNTPGNYQQRDVEMPFVVVDRPAGGSQAQRSYTDLFEYATYSDLLVKYPTYLALLSGP